MRTLDELKMMTPGPVVGLFPCCSDLYDRLAISAAYRRDHYPTRGRRCHQPAREVDS